MYKLQFTSVSIERQGSRFSVELDLLFLSGNVGENASHMFVPVLADGTRRLELPSVLVAGCRRYRAFKWFMWWFGRDFLRAYKIKKVLKSGSTSVFYPYRVCLDYEEWMSNASVQFLEQRHVLHNE